MACHSSPYLSSEVFERYSDELLMVFHQIETHLNKDPSQINGLNLFQQAEDLLKQMALEARSISDTNEKCHFLEQVRTLKCQLRTYQAQLEKSNLMSSYSYRNGQLSSATDDEKVVRQKNEVLILNQNDALERAARTMQETETVALQIQEELAVNRETLMSAQARVHEVEDLTGRAKKILQSMSQRFRLGS